MSLPKEKINSWILLHILMFSLKIWEVSIVVLAYHQLNPFPSSSRKNWLNLLPCIFHEQEILIVKHALMTAIWKKSQKRIYMQRIYMTNYTVWHDISSFIIYLATLLSVVIISTSLGWLGICMLPSLLYLMGEPPWWTRVPYPVGV